MLYFPPHLINASALPYKTEHTDDVSFHVNVACWFANRHTTHIGIITKVFLQAWIAYQWIAILRCSTI